MSTQKEQSVRYEGYMLLIYEVLRSAAASAARYARSRGRIYKEQHANEADREAHDLSCQLTTCKCQELYVQGNNPDTACMYQINKGRRETAVKYVSH